MKTRYLACSVGVVAVIAAWWLLRPAMPITGEATATTSPTTADSPIAAPASALPARPALTPQVAVPKVAPVAARVLGAAATVVDNQKDLSTAIPELVQMVQSGDLVTAWQNYAQPDFFAQIPPDRHARVDEALRAITTSPDGQMRVQILSTTLNGFSSQTPTYNEAGDTATYQISGPAAAVGLNAVHFKKVDGRWYIQDDDLNRIGRLLGL